MDSVAVFAADTLEEKHVYPPGVMDRFEENLEFSYRAFRRVDFHRELRNIAFEGRPKWCESRFASWS
jgi:salicylate hydroxylase